MADDEWDGDDSYVVLTVSPNSGYAPDQVHDSVTVEDLHDILSGFITDGHGDKRIVLNNGQRYGARYGHIPKWDEPLFTAQQWHEMGDDS